MIREITANDADSAIELIKELNPQEPEFQRSLFSNKLTELQNSNTQFVYGFEKNNKIIALFTISKIEGITHDLKPFAIIESLVVNSKFRNQKIGFKLMQYAIQVAKKWNCYKLILETGTKQDWKLKFYEKAGFTFGDKSAFIIKF